MQDSVKRQRIEAIIVDRKKKKTEKKLLRAAVREIISFAIYVVLFAGILFLLQSYVLQRTQVSGRSMEATLQDGDMLLVDKLSYDFKEPKRFDIVPFEYSDGVYYIKRIIGLPGETVRIDENGTIYINGKVLDESYGLEVIKDPGIAINEIKLGDDEFFVLGDNRNNSKDSRFAEVGNIRRSQMLGRAFLRITPFSNFGLLD